METAERILQAIELISSRYLLTIETSQSVESTRGRTLMLDVRDGAIDEQEWLRHSRDRWAEVDLELLDSYRFLLARIEVLVDSAIADETVARSAGQQLGEVVAAMLPLGLEFARGNADHLQRLLRVLDQLAADRPSTGSRT
jgi:hypothetical protein